MINDRMRYILAGFGYLVPLFSEITKENFIELIKETYSIDNDRIRYVINDLESFNFNAIKRSPKGITIKR